MPAKALMGSARVEQITESGAPLRVYFHDADGNPWRIHDRAFGPPYAQPYKARTFRHVGDPRAAYRWFVRPRGSARLYKFAPRDHHLADLASLERQFRCAQYPSTPTSSDEALEQYYRMLAASRDRELRGQRKST